jgi:hypothetical protein
VRPSALAVVRLITSSYFVGAWTGRSAGLAFSFCCPQITHKSNADSGRRRSTIKVGDVHSGLIFVSFPDGGRRRPTVFRFPSCTVRFACYIEFDAYLHS